MKKHILIVDDCNTTRKLLSYMVRERGYSTVGACNGIEALEKLATHDIGLVVTDLNMPQMDGLELSRNIRYNETYKDLPVIMITTESGEEDMRVARESGVTSYLVKPVSPQRLVGEIAKFLEPPSD